MASQNGLNRFASGNFNNNNYEQNKNQFENGTQQQIESFDATRQHQCL